MTFQNPADPRERFGAANDAEAGPSETDVEVVHALALEGAVATIQARGDRIIQVRAFSTAMFSDYDAEADDDDTVLELGHARAAHIRLALFVSEAPLKFDFFEVEFEHSTPPAGTA